MNILNRRMALMSQSGEKLFYNERTGAHYPKYLNITIVGGRGSGRVIDNGVLNYRWAYCEELEEAIIDSPLIAGNTKGSNLFRGCPKLKRIELLGGITSGSNNFAESCPYLETVILGSVGYPNGVLNNNTAWLFRDSGKNANNKTITIYVDDNETIPFVGEPWGLTGATVIYRSATTGQVLGEQK